MDSTLSIAGLKRGQFILTGTKRATFFEEWDILTRFFAIRDGGKSDENKAGQFDIFTTSLPVFWLRESR